ncbi:MAG: carbohydrate-binding domain-containing protein [Deltaproteobacteria bacterium]|nr:carbohydrate-binding domain-containing protein [Deltaproteobacteria bacterium]
MQNRLKVKSPVSFFVSLPIALIMLCILGFGQSAIGATIPKFKVDSCLSRHKVNFGTKQIGTINSEKFTIRNTGTSPLNLSSFIVTNDDINNQDFSLSDDSTCEGASLEKGETCIVWFYFKPLNAGIRTGTLSFIYNDETNTPQARTVLLKGKATGEPNNTAPVINSFTATPSNVTLGESVILSWDVSDATSLSINPDVGVVSGTSVCVTPKTTGEFEYILTASNAYGSSIASVTVTVSENTGGINISSFAVSKAESASTYDPADIVNNTKFDYTVLIDFTANTAQLSTGNAQQITSAGIALTSEITIAPTTYGITIVSTSASPVKYILSGILSGTLTVSSSNKYCLYLKNVTINASSGPAIYLESESKAFIVTAPDTANTLTDAASSGTMKKKGALHSQGSMIFSGDGQLNVTGNYKHGIYSNDYIRISGGELDVEVSVKDAIRSVNAFIFDDGHLTIRATGTTIDDESKGVKVEGLEGERGACKGYVIINGGHITITSVGKAITAGWDIDEDSETTSTLDDPSPYVEINNGVIVINTTGTPYEYIKDGETVSCSPEGIEGKSYLTINSAYMVINTTDDALNAGNSITINGGYIYAASSTNDSIDSNGTLTITGGVIVAIGAEIPEGAFDCDRNTFQITGGTFVGIAGDTSIPTAGVCTQNSIIYNSLAAGNTMSLKSADGTTVVFAYQIPRSYSTMLFSCPDIAMGAKYSIIIGGTATGDYDFYGLYFGNLNYTGGSTNTSFTVTSTVTNLKNR